MRNETKNKMVKEYLSLTSNHAICIDITTLGVYGELLLAIDLAGRNILVTVIPVRT